MQSFYKLPIWIQAGSVGVSLTFLSYAVALLVGWIDLNTIPYLEVLAVATSYACTYLCVIQSRWNYPVGVVTTLLYAILFFQWGLLGSMIVNLYLMIQLLYGWFRWGPDRSSLKVTHASLPDWAMWVVVTLLTYFVAVLILTLMGATLSGADAAIMVFTILAQWLLDNKKLETWFVWVLVNILAIGTYLYAGLALAGLQYIFFLGNTIYGYVMWKKSMNPSTINHEVDWEDGKLENRNVIL